MWEMLQRGELISRWNLRVCIALMPIDGAFVEVMSMNRDVNR